MDKQIGKEGGRKKVRKEIWHKTERKKTHTVFFVSYGNIQWLHTHTAFCLFVVEILSNPGPIFGLRGFFVWDASVGTLPVPYSMAYSPLFCCLGRRRRRTRRRRTRRRRRCHRKGRGRGGGDKVIPCGEGKGWRKGDGVCDKKRGKDMGPLTSFLPFSGWMGAKNVAILCVWQDFLYRNAMPNSTRTYCFL